MNLHPVTDGPRKNRWCGPAVLSALTGRTTDDVADLIRRITGRRQVTRTSAQELEQVLKLHGLRMVPFSKWRSAAYGDSYGKPTRPTFAAWLRRMLPFRTPGRVFLVDQHHWVLVSGRRFVDSLTRDVVTIKHEKVRRRARVVRVWEIVKAEGAA